MHKLFFENLVPQTLLFGRFRLVRCLTANHSGGVYLCRDEAANLKRVVIKILSSAGSVRERGKLERLQNEVTISGLISSPNVCSAKAFFRDDDFMAIVLEYADAGSLENFTTSGVQRNPKSTLGILQQILQGVRAIHRAGVLHRDLKPANVLAFSDGRIAISDFGISHRMKDLANAYDQGILGTLDYMSPEYLKDGVYDERSDLYSLGVISYQLLTGKLPFSSSSVYDSVFHRVLKDPIPPKMLAPKIPEGLNQITLKALSRQAEDRYQSADEFLNALMSSHALSEETSSRWKLSWLRRQIVMEKDFALTRRGIALQLEATHAEQSD